MTNAIKVLLQMTSVSLQPVPCLVYMIEGHDLLDYNETLSLYDRSR
jgi:hypothetical protein